EGREVVMAGGETVAFDRALIATGARNRRLGVAGEGLDGVLELRTIDHSDRIREAAATGGRFALVGMGFVGAEVAASLRQLGSDVTVIELFETALSRVLCPEL